MSIDKIKDLSITKEIKASFLDYAMSVIVSRALPDSRDGLKPVHRRILFSMNDLGMHSDKAYKKSARIVGDVLGKYHPHGDSSVYGAMVRLAQEFATRYPLVDGHGNFGSIDGDGAAAMRYTEARMSKIAMELVKDINKNTIDFVDNYDGSEQEPSVLPSKFPNLIVNGTTGIAVGMATNIPPHNLGEVIDGVISIMDNPEITNFELMDYIDGPDFPTGAAILGRSGFKRAYETGKGSVTVRSKTEIINVKGRDVIIVSEIPYQVNKAKVVEKIGELVRDKKIEGISALRDESNRLGIRIVIEVKREANANVILNNLYKQTSLQVNFSINLLSLVNGEPKLMDLKSTLVEYIKHQVIVMKRRSMFELNKAQERAHILEGLKIALDNIDAIIAIIRSSSNDAEASEKMMSGYNLSEIQAKAILEMRLRRLTSLEGQKVIDELNILYAEINRLNELLGSDELINNAIKEELMEIKNRFSDKRRTVIDTASIDIIEDEALIPVEDIVITLTKSGYVKRLASDTYRAQNRGGRGIKGMATNEEDQVDRLIFASTHQNLLFFTNLGKVYRIKGYSIPEFGRSAKGIPIVNLIQIDKGEFVKAIIPVSEGSSLFFVTKKGVIKKTDISEFENIRANGKIALGLKDEDEVLEVAQVNETDEILIASDAGKLIRFTVSSIRALGRSASGVRGMRIGDDEIIIGMAVTTSLEDEVLVLTESGFGKRTNVEEYRLQTRGGKGVKTVNITEKNGKLVGLLNVSSEEFDILVITTEGIIIRIPVSQVSQTGRSTQGVRIIKVKDGEKVANVALIASDVSRETSNEDLEVDTKEEIVV